MIVHGLKHLATAVIIERERGQTTSVSSHGAYIRLTHGARWLQGVSRRRARSDRGWSVLVVGVVLAAKDRGTGLRVKERCVRTAPSGLPRRRATRHVRRPAHFVVGDV